MPHNENSRVKIPALVHFTRLGYKYISLRKYEGVIDDDTNILVDVLCDAINRINATSLTTTDVQKIVNALKAMLENDDLGREFYSVLINGYNGLKLIDFEDFGGTVNSYHVVTEMTCKNALYSEVCNRIALINRKKLLEEAQDMSAILNLAMDEIEFHFRKVSEKELVIADKYQDTLNRTRKAVLHTLDPKDPEYITLLEELQRLLAKKNIEELTADEMTADIEALERIRKLAEQKNLADQMLAAKYDGDVKFMRTHKRLRETPSPIAGDVALHQVLTHLKHRVDSQVLSNSHLMDNEPYFMQGMFPMIKQELDAQHLKYSAAQIKYIGTCISNEYFTERNFAS